MSNKHSIPKDQAKGMTKKFREKRDHILAPEFKNKDILPKCETFDRAAFDRVLAQDGCTSIRIYYGMDAEDKVHAIIVGVDAQNRDMLKSSAANVVMDGVDDEIIENGDRCPTVCSPPPSELNS